MTDAPENDGFEPVKLVFMYACNLQGGGKGAVLLRQDNGEQVILDYKSFKSGWPGSIYVIPTKGDTYRIGKMYFDGQHTTPDLDAWRLKHDRILGEWKASAFFKSAKGRAAEKGLEAMADIRQVYRSTDSWGRLIIEARLLQYLRFGT